MIKQIYGFKYVLENGVLCGHFVRGVPDFCLHLTLIETQCSEHRQNQINIPRNTDYLSMTEQHFICIVLFCELSACLHCAREQIGFGCEKIALFYRNLTG